MDFRKEIRDSVSFLDDKEIDSLVAVFKKFALEVVGNDDTLDDFPGPEESNGFKQAGVNLVNDIKQGIRQRIEEATK